MASTLKDFDRLSVKIDCNGPIEGIIAEATRDGGVRGYVKNPDAEVPARDYPAGSWGPAEAAEFLPVTVPGGELPERRP